MKIISFINSKGGVGKTTLATNLARYLYTQKSIKSENSKILLVDADPQGSVRDWNESGAQTEIHVISADRKETLFRLPAYLKENAYDYVIIDTPGKAQEITGSAIAISDLCLIPVQPSPYDLWSSMDVIELIKARHTVTNGKPDTFYVLNRCIPNTKIGAEVKKHLEEGEIKLLCDPIHQRIVFSETARYGKTVFDASIDLARAEIKMLGDIIIFHFEEKKRNELCA